MRARKKRGLFVSRRAWLTQALLSRLRAVGEPVVSDAALRFLAEAAARRMAEEGHAYGAVNYALGSAGDLLAAVSKLERPNASKQVTAAMLKRLSQEGKLPQLPPWT